MKSEEAVKKEFEAVDRRLNDKNFESRTLGYEHTSGYRKALAWVLEIRLS